MRPKWAKRLLLLRKAEDIEEHRRLSMCGDDAMLLAQSEDCGVTASFSTAQVHDAMMTEGHRSEQKGV